MKTDLRERLEVAAILIAFFVAFGITGRMELEAMNERKVAHEQCQALLLANDWDATGCVGRFSDLNRISREMWGPDGDPETGKDN